MYLATKIKKPLGILPAEAPKALTMQHLLDGLPPTLKTVDNLLLLKTYFLIPQPSVRRFMLVLFARITDDKDTAYPVGDLSEAKYLLTQFAGLPTDGMRDKVLAMVRQICAANGGDT